MKIQFGNDVINIPTYSQYQFEAVLNRVKSTIGRKFNRVTKIWYVPFNRQNYDILKSYLPDELKQKYENYFLQALQKLSQLTFLRFYQKEAVEDVIYGKKLISLPLGSGKTLVALAYLSIFDFPKTLIIAPNSLLKQWQSEALKHFNLQSVILEGSPTQRNTILQSLQPPYILILNYEKVILKDVKEFLQSNHFNLLILDEAHKIKNHKTKTYKALRQVKADNKILLTATPLINSPMDVFNIVNFAHPDYFNYKNFTQTYLVFDEIYNPRYGEYIRIPVGVKNLEQLHEELKPIMVFKTKQEILKDLPPKTEVIYEVEPTQYQQELHSYYYFLPKQQDWDVSNQKDFYNMLACITMMRLVVDSTKLLEFSNSELAIQPQHIHHPKIKLLKEEILPFLEGKTIIFTEFAKMADILYNELKDYQPFILKGGMDINATLQKFKESSSKLLISTDVINFGVNLQFIQNLIHYDLPWSPAKLQQREGRIHRIGQDNPVTIIKIITKNTIEEKIHYTLQSKLKQFKDAVAGGMEIDSKEIIKLVWGGTNE